MLELITSLISGSGGILAGIAAILAAIGAAYRKGKSVQRTNQKAKDADALEKHYQDIANANDARNRVQPSDSVQSDPYRRD